MIKTSTTPEEQVISFLMDKGVLVKDIKMIKDEEPNLIIIRYANDIPTKKIVDLSLELMKNLEEEFNKTYLVDLIPS